jgi:predicted AAA+ superfamily ATPase
MPVVVVTGMRQVGKTTLLRHEPGLRERRYLNLDDFATLEAARRNPEALLADDQDLTIDEAQKCPELLTLLKTSVDRRRRPGRFLLSGSANFSLLKSVSESLAGRAVILQLHPFSRREILAEPRRPFLTTFFRSLRQNADFSRALERAAPPLQDAEILRGGMPSVCLGEVRDPGLWFRGFEQTYLERDLRSLAQVADLTSFRRVMQLASLRTGQILNRSELARDAGLNAVTAGRYLGLLETSFLVRLVPPFLGNRTSRLMKSPKLFFADSGLAAHLAGVRDVSPASDEPLRGPLFETYVATNLVSLLEAHWPEASLHYWHVQGRHEVDFVLEDGRDTLALEIKAASRWDARDLSGLEKFLERTPRCRAAVLAHNGTSVARLGERLWALPIALLLS